MCGNSFDHQPVLRVLVVGEEVDALLEECLRLLVAGGPLLLHEDAAYDLKQLWHAVRQGHQPQLVQFLV